MDVADAREWLDRLGRAWRQRDPEAAAGLFTVDASYRSSPFRSPYQGRSEIAGYWASATESQTDIEVAFGEPVVAGDRMAVEWWSVVIESGQPMTDAGGLFLTFENGQCSDLREYWNLTEGAVEVPDGWGR
jgi:ketosteroid isomerase-like protein